MLKLLGTVLTIGTFSAGGMHFSLILKRRCQNLSGIITAFELIKSELCFAAAPLCDIMLAAGKVCSGQSSRFFAMVRERMQSDEQASFFEIFNDSLSALESLNDDDKRILSDAAAFLGKYDSERQLDALNYSIRRLNARLHQAEKEFAQKSGLYRALGAGAGVAAVLIAL